MTVTLAPLSAPPPSSLRASAWSLLRPDDDAGDDVAATVAPDSDPAVARA